ncbi:PLP-dependent aminotransferase family protein [Roseibium sp.]|uniref:aminotransferase-like domain-containing protein n=1 Tax=Roseibium sp. TaxID=1936156 RepID=UPI003A96F332
MQDWKTLFASRARRMTASEIRELLKLLDQPDMISFAGGIPDPSLFPAAAFEAAFKDLFASGQHRNALQYSVSEGYKPLRSWIVRHMASLGIPCDEDNIVITSGAQQGLDYLGKLFLSPGDTAVVGWPTYLGALQAFNAYEPAYERLDLSRGATAGWPSDPKIKFIYATADFANPSGESLTLAERNALLDQAEARGLAVIEDAPYEALRYEGEVLPSLLALDIARCGSIEDARTIFCGSFSKTLSPGMRLGWICAPKPVIQQLVLTKQAADLNTSTINQMVMATVAETCYADQVAMIRDVYKTRRDAMLTALERHMPAGVTWNRPEGGMFLWLELPAGFDAGQLLQRAVTSARVAFVPGHAFFADGSVRNTMRLSFTVCGPDKIEEGIRRLGEVLSEEIRAAA